VVCRAGIGVTLQEAQLRLAERDSDVNAGAMAIHPVLEYASGVVKDMDHGPCIWRQKSFKLHEVTGFEFGHEEPQRKKRKAMTVPKPTLVTRRLSISAKTAAELRFRDRGAGMNATAGRRGRKGSVACLLDICGVLARIPVGTGRSNNLDLIFKLRHYQILL
jgi:hypothetical protein